MAVAAVHGAFSHGRRGVQRALLLGRRRDRSVRGRWCASEGCRKGAVKGASGTRSRFRAFLLTAGLVRDALTWCTTSGRQERWGATSDVAWRKRSLATEARRPEKAALECSRASKSAYARCLRSPP